MVKNSYYLYIDDSGKFHSKVDQHIVYSFLLFDKGGRKKYFDDLLNASKKSFGAEINNMYLDDNGKLIKNSLLAEVIKGSDFCKNYSIYSRNSSSNDIRFLDKYNSFLTPYGHCLCIGSVVWCRNKEKGFDENNRYEKSYILKKSIMISAILSFLVENKEIEKNAKIKIYIDEEADDNLSKDFKKNQLLSYLNIDIKPSELKETKRDIKNDIGINANTLNEDIFSSDVYCSSIKKANLKVVDLEFLDSSASFFVQGADILANLTFKILNHDSRGDAVLNYLRENNSFLKTKILPNDEVINLSNGDLCCRDLGDLANNNINKVMQNDEFEN